MRERKTLHTLQYIARSYFIQHGKLARNVCTFRAQQMQDRSPRQQKSPTRFQRAPDHEG